MAYVDLFLVHLPSRAQKGPRGWRVPVCSHRMSAEQARRAVWTEFVSLKADGLAMSIGVSNWGLCQLRELQAHSQPLPDVYMGEYHPSYHAETLRDFLSTQHIAFIAYGSMYALHRSLFAAVSAAAKPLGVSVPTLLLKWALQQNLSVIPRSVSPST